MLFGPQDIPTIGDRMVIRYDRVRTVDTKEQSVVLRMETFPYTATRNKVPATLFATADETYRAVRRIRAMFRSARPDLDRNPVNSVVRLKAWKDR